MPYKFIIKLFIYSCTVYVFFIGFILLSNNKYFLKSRFDPNYWIIYLNLQENIKTDSKIRNLINLTKNNKKYKSISFINYIYYYNHLSNSTKDLFIELQ